MDRDHDVLWKFLYNVIELGTRLCDLSVSKQGFCVKEPEVRVFGPKIRELDGNLGDILGGGWDCCFFNHDDAGVIS